jgi:hypothetical protein
MNAVAAASASFDDREVHIPANEKGSIFHTMPFHFKSLSNITFTIDGAIVASEDNENWPMKTDNGLWDFWTIEDSENIHIRGSGSVEGKGYWWWMREYIVANKHGRPHLVKMERV